MKLIKNENGSTLVVVVLFISILAIMGFALVATTSSHLRTQKTQEERKLAFYASESGIDEVIATLTQMVQEVHGAAVTGASASLTSEIAEQARIYEAYLYNQRAQADGLPQIGGAPTSPPDLFLGIPGASEANGTINQAEAHKYAEAEYKRIFKAEFASLITDRFDRVSDTADFMSHSYTSAAQAEIGLLMDDGDEVAFDIDMPDTVTLPFFSFYHPDTEKSSHKLLTVDIAVKLPDYTPIVIEQNVMKFEPNILWTKALTADGSIIIKTGNVSVYGNIFAYGDPDLSNVTGKRGIVVGNNSTNTGTSLSIQGEAVTSGDICFHTDGSRLEINGNVYANNIIVDSENDDVRKNIVINLENGSNAFTSYSISAGGVTQGLEATGNMVVKNNLEMRGSNTEININGSFTGFSDPVTGGSDDDTSCIIVDTEDLLGSSGSSKLTIAEDTVICGIAYLSSEGLTGRFNTGESIALRENYNVYKNMLTNLPAPSGGHDYFNQFAYTAFEENAADVDESQMTYWSPRGFGLFAPYQYKGQNISNDIFNLADYLYHITYMVKDTWFSGLPDEEKNRLELQGIIDNVVYDNGIIQINPLQYYSYGVGFANGGILRRTDHEWGMLDLQSNARTMFFGQIHAFGDLAFENGSDNFFNAESGKQSIRNQFSFYNLTDALVNERAVVDGQGNEIVIVSENNVNISSSPETIKGVVITKGDVTLTGPLDFRGTIIAQGDIIIEGDVTITNDRDFIAKAMAFYGDTDLADRRYLVGFKQNETVWPTYSFKTYSNNTDKITKDDFTYVYDKSAGLTEKYNSIKDLVKTSNWKVEEY